MWTHPTRPMPTRPVSRVICGSVLLVVGVLGGCQNAERVQVPRAGAPSDGAFAVTALEDAPGSRRDAYGDWDDVHASVLAAASRCQMAHERVEVVASEPGVSGERRVYDLLTLHGPTGRLEVERLGADEGVAVGERIRLTAVVGPVGSTAHEACLLEALATRLEQLRGVGAAPIRWSGSSAPGSG